MNEEAAAFQAQLELFRANPEDEQIREDLAKAKRELEIAWLNLNMERA